MTVEARRWFAALLVFIPVAAWATSYVDRPLRERVQRADRVVIAKVLKVDVANEGTPPRLQTIATLDVEDALKGPRTDRITVRQLGGSSGGWTSQVPGALTWDRGERAVFLLRCRDPKAPDACTLAGLRDAKLTLSGEHVLDRGVNTDAVTRLTLDELRKIIAESAR